MGFDSPTLHNKINITETTNKFAGQYWESLNKLNLPYYLYLDEELVIVETIEKRKRKNGAKIDQVYYHLKDGRVKHASFFKKVDIKVLKREFLINSVLN